ncbi:MAG: hypothetical protein ACKOEV_14385 [Cytophagales bacterium]
MKLPTYSRATPTKARGIITKTTDGDAMVVDQEGYAIGDDVFEPLFFKNVLPL